MRNQGPHPPRGRALHKVLSNDKFTTAIKERIGEAYETQLMPWLVNIANDGNAGSSMGMGPINRLIEASKANTTAAVLGFQVLHRRRAVRRSHPRGRSRHDYRVSPPPVQRLHQAVAAQRIAPRSFAMIKELSPEMAHREEHLDRDMRARLQTLRGDDALTAKWNRAAFHAGARWTASSRGPLGWVPTTRVSPGC